MSESKEPFLEDAFESFCEKIRKYCDVSYQIELVWGNKVWKEERRK